MPAVVPIIYGASAIYGAYSAKKAATAQQKAAQAAADQYTPYREAGLRGLAGLANMQPFQAPTSAEAMNDPGYQFARQQGEQARERSAAAHGTLLSGGFQRSLSQFNQGLASEQYGNVYNRARQQYQDQYSNLYGLANMGREATGAATGYSTDAAAAGAAGTIGVSNALTGGLSNAYGGYLESQYRPQMPNTASSYGTIGQLVPQGQVF